MRRVLIAVLTAFALSAASMAFAQDAQKNEKNECLLIAKGCRTEVDSIQQKIRKINAEIKKGTKVYTPEELKQLNQMLKEAKDIIIELEKPRGK